MKRQINHPQPMKTFMLSAFEFFRCRSLTGPAWLLSLTLVAGGMARAQNFVVNPDFDQPLGPGNWSVVYVGSTSESDWYMHGRSTLAHRDKVFGTWDGNHFGAHFRPYTGGLMEAYLSQVVTNLIPGSNYNVTCWGVQLNDWSHKIHGWLESVGGNGAQPSGTPVYITGYTHNGGGQGAGNNGWQQLSANNTADANGNIEVRLRSKVYGSTVAQKWLDMDILFDQVAVMPAWDVAQPPFHILSVSLTNQTATLKWETIMNNTYRVDISPDLESWSTLKDKLGALGTNLTFTTNLSANDPTIPAFFRVFSKTYTP